jgi:3-deoxy-manno-octulosonate cytidylyltransferase (CMP-KDO synthetase)
MITTAIIPARLASKRLPKKVLISIEGKSLIQRVYESAKNTQLFDRVIIATDHMDILSHAKSFNAEVVMTAIAHQSGTDRVEECARSIQSDLIVNIQGDEPFIAKEPLKKLIDEFENQHVQIASLMHIIDDEDTINNPDNVKVITDIYGYAVYFSRSAIPFVRNSEHKVIHYKHIGVYAYRQQALSKFVSLPISYLEKTESLEQLRLIENGIKIKMVLTDYKGIGIDTYDDLEAAKQIIRDNYET